MRCILLLWAAAVAHAQIFAFPGPVGSVTPPGGTQVFIRSSAPPVLQICNVSNPASSSTAPTVTACLPNTGGEHNNVTVAHGFPSGCGTSQVCMVSIGGVVTDNAGQGGAPTTCPSYGSTAVQGVASYANGRRTIKLNATNPTTQFDLYDTTGVGGSTYVGNPLPSTGNWCIGQYGGGDAPIQYVALLSAETLGANGPWGYADGLYGTTNSRLYLNATNTTGGPTLTVSGCSAGGSSTCVVAVSFSGTPYNPMTASIPTAAGQKFSIGSTGTNLDSTSATSCLGTGSSAEPLPYTVATVNSTGWTSTQFSCSIANGVYAGSSLCGPPASPNDGGPLTGSLPCQWVSQLAYKGNPTWDNIANIRSGYYLDDTSTTNYKYVLDGGLNNTNGTPYGTVVNPYQAAADAFFVEWDNAQLFRDIQYAFQQPWMSGGVSWLWYNAAGDGNDDLRQSGTYAANYWWNRVYNAYRPYAAATTHNAFLNYYNNDFDSPGYPQCTTAGVEVGNTSNVNYVIGQGTSQFAPSSTQLTLQSGAVAAAGEVIAFNTAAAVAGTPLNVQAVFGVITSVTGSGTGTPVITVSGGFNTNDVSLPATVVQYAIYASAQWSTNTAGSTATVTLTPSTLTPTGLSIAVGNAVAGANTWGDCSTSNMCYSPFAVECKVTSIGGGGLASNQFKCTNGQSVSSSNTSTPAMLWNFPGISVSSSSITSSVGNCGARWSYKKSQAGFVTPKALYGVGGLELGSDGDNSGAIPFISNQMPGDIVGLIAMDLSCAPYDDRCLKNLAEDTVQFYDMGYQAWTSFASGGVLALGAGYLTGIMTSVYADAMILSRSLPGNTNPATFAPSVDPALLIMYHSLPDFKPHGGCSPCAQPLCWNGACGNAEVSTGHNGGSEAAQNVLNDPGFSLQPAADSTARFKDWLTNILATPVNGSTNPWGTNFSSLYLLSVDPTSGGSGSSYQSQPLQYDFHGTQQSAVATQSGCNASNVWVTGYASPVCPPGGGAAMMLSRTKWANYGDTADACGSVLVHHAAQFQGGHGDNPGALTKLYKCGNMVGTDNVDEFGDLSWLGSAMRFGDATDAHGYTYQFTGPTGGYIGGTLYPNIISPSYASQLRWTSQNHGSWPANYGDQSSSVSHICTDSSGQYQTNLGVSYDVECVTHFKGSGLSEWVVDGHEAAVASSESIQHAIHYPQAYAAGGQPDQGWAAGTTACLNPSGGSIACSVLSGTLSALTGSNLVHSLTCSGGATCPPTQEGVLTQIFSPNTITVNWDGSSYTGNGGASDRVTIAGGSSVGASVSAFEDIVVHSIQTGTALVTSDAFTIAGGNWWGYDGCTAISCIAYLQARNNCTAASCTVAAPSWTTQGSTSLPRQYLITGVPSGTWSVSVAGTTVVSGYVVAGGDNTIAFTASSGTTGGAVLVF